MMRLEDRHNYVRYCRPNQIADNGKILSAAFVLRKKNPKLNRSKDETELSVDWFEYFKRDHYKRIKSALAKRLTISQAGKLAKLNCGRTKAAILHQFKFEIYIEVVDKSYAHLLGLYENQKEDTEILLLDLFLNQIDEVKSIGEIT
ncbi:hypothetical protein [Treponema primitia]|uniref:hypothetical protein n=1 Tax=Treponema primitia TaxID=88058 RepID=UPI0004751BB1|nr:hypothetical protein [Treponema primitia]